jgi:hypothetical protein
MEASVLSGRGSSDWSRQLAQDNTSGIHTYMYEAGLIITFKD